MTDRFPEVRERVISYFQSRGSFRIHVKRLIVHEGMLWLEIDNGGELQQVHKDLDKLLLEEFGIAQHRFDKQFAPHISLFTDRNKDKINDMYDAICEDLSPEHLTVTQIVVGAGKWAEDSKVNCHIATTYFELLCNAYGLGTTIMSYFNQVLLQPYLRQFRRSGNDSLFAGQKNFIILTCLILVDM